MYKHFMTSGTAPPKWTDFLLTTRFNYMNLENIKYYNLHKLNFYATNYCYRIFFFSKDKAVPMPIILEERKESVYDSSRNLNIVNITDIQPRKIQLFFPEYLVPRLTFIFLNLSMLSAFFPFTIGYVVLGCLFVIYTLHHNLM